MSNYEKPDYWSLKARKEGYPARSVYKLQELDERFGLFRQVSGTGGTPLKRGPASALRVLDLGAAPGSWSLYALRRMRQQGFLVAVDLSPLSRQYDQGLFGGENFRFIQGDITEGAIRETILAQAPFSLVLSDAAPATTGNSSVDTLRSLALAETALEYAATALIPGGSLVVKVFQGGDTPGLLTRIRELFKTGKGFKPTACRSESFEIYYLGICRTNP
ncbi:MAG: RlmE family RNA methyltransferase [Treponema sp.]|jgi:23S rRNA (uridine2552-2'-O)-methyltransferase|nr:RlmE family RNA methyltransferase [Treponema sp.]